MTGNPYVIVLSVIYARIQGMIGNGRFNAPGPQPGAQDAPSPGGQPAQGHRGGSDAEGMS